MFLPSRYLTTWMLAAWFAALVGVRDGWHLVPGNGHWVETPAGYGVYLGLGAGLPAGDMPGEESAVQDDGSAPGPWKTEDECDTCRLSGQDTLPRASLECPLPRLTSPRTPQAIRSVIWVCVPQPFQARAPPRV
jgi:hypothetical protein